MPSPAGRPAEQQIRFCTSSDGVRIAFATTGTGPPLVKAANWLSHLDFDSQSPVWRHWIRELSRDHALVRYDERGCGLSQWEVDEFSLDAWVRDLEAVVDALALERFALLGISQGGPIGIAYAARHPERVSHLILYGTYARGRGHRRLSEREREEREVMLRMIRIGWGTDHAAFRQVFTSLFIPGGTPEQFDWFNELQRISATPENAARMVATFDGLNVQELAPTLRVPTLVLHATGELRVPFEEGRLVASLIPGARLVPLEGRNHLLLDGEPAWDRFLVEVRHFLGVPEEPTLRADVPDSSSDPRRRRLTALFDEVVELEPAERPAVLARRCAEDLELRREVEQLLALAEQSGLTARLKGGVLGALPSSRALAPGSVVAKYEVLEQIGRGGMGVVYKARDRRLGRLVALKFMDQDPELSPEAMRRFQQEARTVASLDHPNLCTILEVEELDRERLFIVMPFYEGETLKARLARGPLAETEVVGFGIQIAEGLAYAHAAGVVHRDIKPANVMVISGSRVKILDFGIAKLAEAGLTRTGAVLGTLAYMSPEQAAGEPVDHRTDLWALGVVLYEMLAGVPPFSEESYEALFAAIQLRAAAPLASRRAEVSPTLAACVHRLLEKSPGDRYMGARELIAELEALRLSSR